jgi:hypothetical protein
MNEQQVIALLAAMAEQTRAQQEQTAAINRLAESNETLAAIIYQSVADEHEEDLPPATYLSGKPKG